MYRSGGGFKNEVLEPAVIDRCGQAIIEKEDSLVFEKFQLPEKYVAGVLGATYYTKQIPVNKWIEIIQAINLPIVFLGGFNEKEIGDHFYREFPNQVYNCTGQLNIAQSAAVIKNSQMVITPDTGMMHIAAALRKPIHVIWGNTIPQFGMYPYFGNENGVFKNHEVTGLTCRPCTKLGYPACPKKHFDCMHKQKMDHQTMEL